MVQEDGHRTRPTFDSAERQRIQRANQIFLRLRKKLHDWDERFDERDFREATQGARWLREVVERHSDSLETAYKDALAASGLPEEDQAYLHKGTEEAGGFSSFVQRDLRKLEAATPNERNRSGDSAPSATYQDLMCGVVAGLLAGGTMMGNSFYFGFALGMSRKNDC
jgi:hypothetical protein